MQFSTTQVDGRGRRSGLLWSLFWLSSWPPARLLAGSGRCLRLTARRKERCPPMRLGRALGRAAG